MMIITSTNKNFLYLYIETTGSFKKQSQNSLHFYFFWALEGDKTKKNKNKINNQHVEFTNLNNSSLCFFCKMITPEWKNLHSVNIPIIVSQT